jgi:hypothetical protein
VTAQVSPESTMKHAHPQRSPETQVVKSKARIENYPYTYAFLFSYAPLCHRARHTAGWCQQIVVSESNEHLLHRVNFLQARILQETQSSQTKVGVEDIDHVARPIGETAQFWILYTLASGTHPARD